ncbi:MAG: hypothetical protein E6J01_04090 [Chloroflexi bacterium]|nr:MAG: hypothetical protein E6J01_04090 [Chloroflexota bacterium]
MTHTPGPSATMQHGLTRLACGCRATEQEPTGPHGPRLIYIQHCSTHAAAPEMLEMIHRAMMAEDPDEWTSDANALLARIEGRETP